MVRRAYFVFAGAVGLLTLLVSYGYALSGAQARALRTAGYGEITMGAARDAAPCRLGEAGTVFLAQGRNKPETTGYLCTSPLGATRIHVMRPAEADRIDWD